MFVGGTEIEIVGEGLAPPAEQMPAYTGGDTMTDENLSKQVCKIFSQPRPYEHD